MDRELLDKVGAALVRRSHQDWLKLFASIPETLPPASGPNWPPVTEEKIAETLALVRAGKRW